MFNKKERQSEKKWKEKNIVITLNFLLEASPRAESRQECDEFFKI